jgi:hypothetical protein
MTDQPKKRYRSSITGRYVTADENEANPDTTIAETPAPKAAD